METIRKTRMGRLNQTKIMSDGTVVQKAIVKEKNRTNRLKRAKWALDIAKDRGLNVPDVVEYGIEDGVEVLKTKLINGVELTSCTEKVKIEAMKDVGNQLLQLSSVGEGFGWPHPDTLIGEFRDWKSFILFYIETYGKSLLNSKIIQLGELEKIKRTVNSINLDLTSACLVHRDVKPNNIINSNFENWIIDWENALLGDNLFDLASYAGNYGHDSLWKSFAEGLEADTNSEKYIFYETVTLIGVTDFLHKRGYKFNKHQNRLIEMVSCL